MLWVCKRELIGLDRPEGNEATLKCKWKTRDGEEEITRESLDELFRPFGNIESIVVKSKSKGSNALISFSSILSANNAMEKLNGGRIKISWVEGGASGRLEALRNREHVPVAVKSGISSMKPVGKTDQEYEDDTLARLMSMKKA
jgi:RNA recognition motif-containing protein